ncbi:LysR substrate-binding domain-containing protein [Bordetella sp. LUAb4]|uniref:LysR substrate-binding domain-containing protein n=1 Tax=Bordetella sp. LUAb4 TaxID=2843195 RepID=UPI001E52FF0E|nr:LysR substrate-binding domain-containing protein [Bordetella sp. LUAb4]
MELRQLKYFVRIVELGSLSRAAKDLYIAQPALSAQIINLEKELDAKLLARSVRGVVPTDAGQSLYLHAQAVLRQIDRLRHDVQGATPSGPVSIGIPTSAANRMVGPLIELVGKRYPEIQLRIVESLSGHLHELATNGRIELSLLFEPVPEAGGPAGPDDAPHHRAAQYQPLVDEHLCLVQARGHAARTEGGRTEGGITLKEAAAMRLVLPGRANITRRIIDNAFEMAGLSANLLAELDSLSTIQAIVTAGQAATILTPSAFVGPDVFNHLSVRPIAGPSLVRRLYMFSSEVVGLGTAAEKVAALIPELIGELVKSGSWSGATFIQR